MDQHYRQDPLSLDIVDQPKMWKMSNQFDIFFLVSSEIGVVGINKARFVQMFFYELVLTNEMHHGINFSLVC